MSQSALSEQTVAPVLPQASNELPLSADTHAELRHQWESLTGQFSFLVPGASRSKLQATDKEEAIRSLVQAMVDAGALNASDQTALVDALLRREELGTTGIGEGVAVPHTKHACVDRVVGAIGYCPGGVDFDSVDDLPVHLVILLVSPSGASREHLLALEAISRTLRDPEWKPWRTEH